MAALLVTPVLGIYAWWSMLEENAEADFCLLNKQSCTHAACLVLMRALYNSGLIVQSQTTDSTYRFQAKTDKHPPGAEESIATGLHPLTTQMVFAITFGGSAGIFEQI